jgi:hypothetical protein
VFGAMRDAGLAHEIDGDAPAGAASDVRRAAFARTWARQSSGQYTGLPSAA